MTADASEKPGAAGRNSRFRPVREWIVVLLFLVGLTAGGVAVEILTWQSTAPSRPDLTLQEFLEERPNVAAFRRFTMDDRTYVEVVGKMPRFTLASKPPVYLFDEGRLVDHGADGSAALRSRAERRNRELMSEEEARAWAAAER